MLITSLAMLSNCSELNIQDLGQGCHTLVLKVQISGDPLGVCVSEGMSDSPPAWPLFPSETHGGYATACPLFSCKGPSHPSASDYCPPPCLSSTAFPRGE